MSGDSIFRCITLIRSNWIPIVLGALFALFQSNLSFAQYTGVDPSGFNAPATNTTGTYYVSWNSPGSIVRVYESKQGVSGETLLGGVPMDKGNVSVTRTNGVYTYRFMRCTTSDVSSCYLWGTKTTTVTIPGGGTSSSSSSVAPPVGVTPAPAPTTSGSTTPVGSMSGSFAINESGSATYTIPIAVPAGVAGVSPKLAIVYDSQSENGLVGVGASISGLGAISRCRQTLLQDGAAKSFTWGAEDRFCLNGQKLMLVQGTYGSPNSQYRTEIDSYVLVTAIGGTTGNPTYFEVEAKDGSVSTYGGTTDSRLSGATTITWALSQFKDSVGNRIEYKYEGDRNSGQRIKTINYGFLYPNSNTSPAASVVFNYENRLDPSFSYVTGGYLFKIPSDWIQ